MAIELYLLDRLKERVQLAKQIDSMQHKVKKEDTMAWFKQRFDGIILVSHFHEFSSLHSHPSFPPLFDDRIFSSFHS